MSSPPIIELTRDPIDYGALTETVRSRDAGAVVLFLGTVREMTDGRRTLALDYDAYPEMARAKMRELFEAACEQWPIVSAGLVHRLGHLELGEISVAVAVSCPHRQQAFEAGRFLIDRLKEVVPVWKQENWADGSTEWVHPAGPTAEVGGQRSEVGGQESGVRSQQSGVGDQTAAVTSDLRPPTSGPGPAEVRS